MKSKSILVLAALLLVACVRESVQLEENGLKTFDCFTVSVEDSPMTKVHMEDGGAVKWDVGDCIGVYSDIQAPVPYYRGEDGKFYGEKVSGTTFYAFYPYIAESYNSQNPLKLTMWVGDNCALPMVAKSGDNTLAFKQTCGVAHFVVSTPLPYSDVSLMGNVENRRINIGGVGYVDLSSETPYLQFEEKDYDYNYDRLSKPFIKKVIDNIEHLYYVLPSTKFGNGITLSFTDVDASGETIFKSTSKEIVIGRGEIRHFYLDLKQLFEGKQYGYPEERSALITLYSALDGENWVDNTNWCSDAPLEQWFGIHTDSWSGHVVSIDLRDNRLRGALPDVFDSLPELRELYLRAKLPIDKNNVSQNIISGTIPTSIWKLKYLETLDLSGNSFSGSLPETIGTCESLVSLHIEGAWDGANSKLDGYEYLTGPLPESIGELSHLLNLNFQCQGLSGRIPSSLSGLKLAGVFFNNNSFSGPLPELDDYSFLNTWLLSGNNFTGAIPASYSHLLDLPLNENSIWLQNNQLSGPLPIEITSHPNFCERAYDFIPYQKEGYWIEIGNIPACRHTFETLDGGTLDLGAQYAKSDYTMIVRWAEWCMFANTFTPKALALAKKYEDKGLQTIWAYGGGQESERIAYMQEVGLDKVSPHIIESYQADTYGLEKDHAIWKSWRGYATPFVEIVDRSGNIVFISDEEGYFSPQPFAYKRDKLDAFLSNLLGGDEYLSTDFSADGKCHTLQTATKGAGVNVVLMGDAFSDRLIADGTYEKVMLKAVDALFSEEPYKSYKDHFSISYVDVVSKNEVYYGETALNTYYGNGAEVGGDDDKVFEYAKNVLSENEIDDALIIVMMNRDYYAGTCYMYSEPDGDYGRGPSIAYFPTSSDATTFNGLVSHEAGGHGFAKLADEYDYPGHIPEEEEESYKSMGTYGWWKNIDFTSDPSQVKWAKFITDDRYASESIGVYEGACTYQYGAWRPTENSIMRYNEGGFNAPSREAIYYRIHKLAYGADWQYNYEDFVTWDLAHRTPAATSARSTRTNFVERAFEPLAPPVVVKKDWRELVRNGR